MDFLIAFSYCFIPLFVAVDPIGIVPSYLALTDGLEKSRLNRVLFQSILTAWGVSLAFMAVGQTLLGYLGITVADFMIAGGALLFVLSLKDLVFSDREEPGRSSEEVGAVPIGVPLIAGPGLLTATLVLEAQHGFWITSLALTVNIALAGISLGLSRLLTRVLGRTGTKTLGKITYLFLAAIAVMFVRRGIELLLKS